MEFSKAKRTQYFSPFMQRWYFWDYKTRKDWRHERSCPVADRVIKKPHRKFANKAVRLYKWEIANGSNYKKIWEVIYNWF